MRNRTDKDANPKMIADKIWATIAGYDIKTDLKQALSQLKRGDFEIVAKGKRARSEMSQSVDDYNPDEDYLD